MKKLLYSALAVSCAIAGVAGSKAAAHRVSASFHFKPGLTVAPTTATLTKATNWSTVISTPTCDQTVTNYVCTVAPDQSLNITTKAQLVSVIQANNGIPATSQYPLVLQKFGRH